MAVPDSVLARLPVILSVWEAAGKCFCSGGICQTPHCQGRGSQGPGALREPVSRPQIPEGVWQSQGGFWEGGEILSGWRGSTPFTTPCAGMSDLLPQLESGFRESGHLPSGLRASARTEIDPRTLLRSL